MGRIPYVLSSAYSESHVDKFSQGSGIQLLAGVSAATQRAVLAKAIAAYNAKVIIHILIHMNAFSLHSILQRAVYTTAR